MALLETVFECPAYKVVRRERANHGDAKGYVPMKHGDRLGLMCKFSPRNGGGDYAKEFKVGTVMGYAIEDYRDPDKAREQNRANGGADHWINGCAVSITANAREQEVRVLVEVGMKVWIEGHRYEIAAANNDNLALVPIAE